MKTAIKVLLGISIALLAYFCYSSIQTPIEFEEVRGVREKQVIASLISIRRAEIEFKNQHGRYTASFDTLIAFVKEGKMKMLKKEGTLSDEQMEKGLTEEKAAAILRRGNATEIAENGLTGFVRDTIYAKVIESLFAGEYDAQTIDNLRYIPFTEKQEFELAVGSREKNSIVLPLFEARAPYKLFLGDLNRQELINLIDLQTKLGKYEGLKVGDVNEPNNNAGNWES